MKDPLTLDPLEALEALREAFPARSGQAERINIDPETVEQDLAKLVLGVMELLRQLMELQAIRRMDAGTLSMSQEEELGTTLMRAEAAIATVAAKFGLRLEDLSLDLGPLGRSI